MFRIVVTGVFDHPHHRKEIARIIRSAIVRNTWCAHHAPRLVIDFPKPKKPCNAECVHLTIVHNPRERGKKPKGHERLARSVCQAVFDTYTHFRGKPHVELTTTGDGTDLTVILIKEEEPEAE